MDSGGVCKHFNKFVDKQIRCLGYNVGHVVDVSKSTWRMELFPVLGILLLVCFVTQRIFSSAEFELYRSNVSKMLGKVLLKI